MPVTDALLQFGLNGPVSLREARRQFERSYILAVLEQNHWRVGAAARALGLQRPNLYRKARQLSIQLKPVEDHVTGAPPATLTASR
jgi:transcriptional regulator with GAF, ATPase, and Fis domain